MNGLNNFNIVELTNKQKYIYFDGILINDLEIIFITHRTYDQINFIYEPIISESLIVSIRYILLEIVDILKNKIYLSTNIKYYSSDLRLFIENTKQNLIYTKSNLSIF